MNCINKVGIIGEGKMGSSIFHYILPFDLDLVWVCSPDADIDKISKQFIKRITRSLDTGIIDEPRFDRLMNTVITRDLCELQTCDLIIEAVPEKLELKKNLFARLNKVVKPDAIFASNSSSINPSEMTPDGKRNGKFIGLHFFFPVSLKNIVELTVTDDTSEHTLLIVESFLLGIQRRFITLDERNSFMLNKIFLDFQNEAFQIVQAGNCSYLEMDHLVRNNIFEFGVFDFCDSVGLDTMLTSIRNYTRGYPHKDYYSGFITTLSELVSSGRLGIKSQEGFFKYPIDVTPVEEPLNTSEIVEHLLQTWLSASKRFTALVHLPIDDANHAIREYFNIEKGPFE